MKNKKMTYILIPIVILVWGIVIFKIFNYTDDSNGANTSPVFSASNEVLSLEKDTFSIIAQYKDPFLGKNSNYYDSEFGDESESQPENSTQVKVPELKKEEPKVAVKFPALVYGGLIYNAKTKKTIALLKINNREYLVNKGDNIDNVEMVEIYNDSIKIKYSNQFKTFIKN
jgi:hypothetical protein